jgi:putative PEP-CTERM system histidine kinase
MHVDNITLAGYSFLLAALGYGAFAFQLTKGAAAHAQFRRTSLLFLLSVLATALWAGCALFLELRSSTSARVCVAALDGLRYGGWFFFLIQLLSVDPLRGRATHTQLLAVAAAALMVLGLLVLPSAWISGAPEITRWPHFLALAQAVLGLLLVEQLFRNLAEDSRWNAKPLCLGLLCVFGFDVYLYSYGALFGRLDMDAAQIRGAVHTLAVPLLWVAASRRADWLTKIQVSRSAVFHSATLLLVGGYLLFISALGYYVRFVGGDWGRALQLGLLVVALVFLSLLALSGAARAKLRVWVGKNFFRYRYDYRHEWLRFTNTLSTKCSPQEVGGLVIRGLADMLESPAGCLWTLTTSSQEMSQSARWNLPSRTERESVQSAFSRFLRSKGWIINLDEFRAFPQRYDDLQLPTWLVSDPQLWLVVPLQVGDELIGFVVLCKARTPVEVNWEVRDLLKTASRQAASYLAQMHATEALLEVRKFDAFNRMSAFVVHDLKNIVTQLSLMMKNAKRLADNPEFQQDMLMTVESSLEKMRQLMLQLREGARPPGGTSGVNLVEIVNRLAQVAQSRGRHLALQVQDAVVARGHEERVERVLGHVVQNAFDATPLAGRVWLSLQRSVGSAQVVVGDTGAGMSEEFMANKLFKPFNTTKQTGMGIGAYESFQYIQELGGRIDVKSQVGRGTVITMWLPLFETQHNSDLPPHERSQVTAVTDC